MDNRQAMRIAELLLCSYDGTAGREEIAELEGLLDQNREAQEYCVALAKDIHYFHCLGQVPLSPSEAVKGADPEFMSELGPQQQLALLEDFAEYEKHAAAIDVPKSREPKKEAAGVPLALTQPVRTTNKFSLAVAVAGIAAFLLMIVYVHLAPPASYEVATVFDSIDAEWSWGAPISSGLRVPSHSKPIRLTRGIVTFRTDDQVEIVVEAPSEFYFSSYSEITLNYGKVFAHVSEEGYGFSVATPNSKIIDLGTDFGVLGHIDGATEVHLYKGKVNIFAGEKHQPKTSQLLTTGSAVKVESRDSSIQPIALDEQALVRHIDSDAGLVWRGQQAVRLTDLLLGGNGFGTATRESIEYEPATGIAVPSGVASYRPGPGKLIGIPESPYLDGIFVPGGGAVTVSSAGHQFADCPVTSGLYYSNVICSKQWSFFEPLEQTFEQSRKHFSDSGLLYLHSNMGLTVDLNAVRRSVPGLRIGSFSAFAGIVRMGSNAPDRAEADVWVLVDGQVRAVRKGLGAAEGFDIEVALSDADAFLTLAVTDGGTVHSEGVPANDFDTCGFAEPVFGLVEPTE